jgi:hypothetical protein
MKFEHMLATKRGHSIGAIELQIKDVDPELNLSESDIPFLSYPRRDFIFPFGKIITDRKIQKEFIYD